MSDKAAGNKPVQVGTRKTAVEDYAIRKVPSTWKWSWFTVINAVAGTGTALFFLQFGAQLTQGLGWINVLVGEIAGIAIVGILAYFLVSEASKQGLDTDMLSRGTGFGFAGSAFTAFIYFFVALVFFIFENQIIGSAISAFVPAIPLWFSLVIASLMFIPLNYYGMKFMARWQTYTLPIFLLFLLAMGLKIASDPTMSAKAGSWMGNLQFNPTNFGLVFAAMFLIFTIDILWMGDYSRFAPKKKSFWGPVLTALIPLSGIGYLLLMNFGTWAAAATGTTDAGAYPVLLLGGLGFLFVIITQIRINVMNIYGGSLGLANVFSRVGRFVPGRFFWVVVVAIVGLILVEIPGAFVAWPYILTLEGVFTSAWVGVIVVDIAINRRLLKRGPRNGEYVEYRRSMLPTINPAGLVSLFLGLVIGIPLVFGGQFGWWGPNSTSATIIASPLAFIISGISIVATTGATKGRYYMRRELIEWPGPNVPVTRCPIDKELVATEDLFPCPDYNQWICAHSCMANKKCGDKCRKYSKEDLLKIPLPLVEERPVLA